MFENKFVNLLLDKIPNRYWNLFSYFLAFWSKPTIGSPIKFAFNGLTLQEYRWNLMSRQLRKEYLDFCYPADLSHRDKEILIDKQYLKNSSIFMVLQSDTTIAASVQLISKDSSSKLPLEYSYNVTCPDTGDDYSPQSGKCFEIYRLRRSFDIPGKNAVIAVTMLFKAIWAKTIQTNSEYAFLTFDEDVHELANLYIKKLNFIDPGVVIRFEGNPKNWRILVKDFMAHENSFASFSKYHFYLQTWNRMNLRNKKWQKSRIERQVQSLLTERDTLFFVDAFSPQRQKPPAFHSTPEVEAIQMAYDE